MFVRGRVEVLTQGKCLKISIKADITQGEIRTWKPSITRLTYPCLSSYFNFGSWIKRDQLDVTCFIISLFNAQRVSDVNTSILRSLRLICWVVSWVVLLWFDVCWCYVVIWLWWCGIRMQAEALPQPAYGYHTTTTKPQRNTNTHRTRAIQPMK